MHEPISSFHLFATSELGNLQFRGCGWVFLFVLTYTQGCSLAFQATAGRSALNKKPFFSILSCTLCEETAMSESGICTNIGCMHQPVIVVPPSMEYSLPHLTLPSVRQVHRQ